MARDEAILRARIDGCVPDTIRFYEWNTPSISLGYFQSAEKEIALDTCINDNISVVRRLTGGRAVFHDKEITYSIIASENNPFISKNIKETFYSISKCILYGLQMLGIKAQIVSRPSNKIKEKNPVCFNSTSWYEISVDNRKLVGTAQSKKNGIILHQGSILLDFDSEKNVKYFNFSKKNKQELITDFNENIAGIKSFLNKSIESNQVRNCLLEGFKKNWTEEFVTDKISEKEIKLETNLYINKYTKSDWNILRKDT